MQRTMKKAKADPVRGRRRSPVDRWLHAWQRRSCDFSISCSIVARIRILTRVSKPSTQKEKPKVCFFLTFLIGFLLYSFLYFRGIPIWIVANARGPDDDNWIFLLNRLSSRRSKAKASAMRNMRMQRRNGINWKNQRRFYHILSGTIAGKPIFIFFLVWYLG